MSNCFVKPNSWSEGEILQSANLRSFAYKELRTVTRNFRPDSLLSECGFRMVHIGWVDETTFPRPAVRLACQLPSRSSTRKASRATGNGCNPNLVKLLGYCLKDVQHLLVYEFMPRGSLKSHIFRRSLHFQPLSWNLRMNVALGAAKGLAFLHSDKANVIYRDFKTANILLDVSYNAKLSDFGLARDGPTDDKSHVSTRVMGTDGYAAPNYIDTGHLTMKCDMYSFSMVLLEMLSGRRVLCRNQPAGAHNLVEWTRPYLESKRRISTSWMRGLAGSTPLAVRRRLLRWRSSAPPSAQKSGQAWSR